MKQLISYQLFRVSIELFKKYKKILLKKINNKCGIYVLHDGEDIYYVGKDKSLGKRLEQHLTDRHKGKWDYFSFYVVKNPKNLDALEKMLISLLKPSGNNLLYERELKKAIKELDQEVREFQEEERKSYFNLSGCFPEPKKIKNSHTSGNSTIKNIQYNLWVTFNKYAKEHKALFTQRKPNHQHWHQISSGNSNAHISLTAIRSPRDKEFYLGCELYIGHNKKFFYNLYNNKSKIEKELHEKLEWMELKGKKASRIAIFKKIDFTQKNNIDKCMKFFFTQSEKFLKVFPKYY